MDHTNSQKLKRKRGVILTQQGFERLQIAKQDLEFRENNGTRFTLEVMSELTELSVDTLMKVFAREVGVDRQTLKYCFRGFGLSLDSGDYELPQDNERNELASSRMRVGRDTFDCGRYVERPPAESICLKTLSQPGSLVRVKAPQMMGKTSLMMRILAQLKDADYRTIHLSFKLADRQIHFASLSKCLQWICLNLAHELDLPNRLNDYWDEDGIGSKVSCTTYLEEYLLAQEDRPLVVCLDDVDQLFPYPEIYEDVFALLRSWYEKAQSRLLWQRLRLAIVHATDVYIRLNINQSPFNVGVPLELPEFTSDQIQLLAEKHGLRGKGPQFDETGFDPLIQLVGGHPFLLELAFEYLTQYPQISLVQLITEAPTHAGIYSNHLRQHLMDLQKHPDLAATLGQVVNAKDRVPIDPLHAYQLRSMGLVTLEGNQALPRCELYRRYFSQYGGGSIEQGEDDMLPLPQHSSLVAIISTDVVNSTSCMLLNQRQMLTILQQDFILMRRLCERYRGLVLKDVGDGLILTFGSAVNAVQCALQIQHDLKKQTETAASRMILKHRIGIHLGDVFLNGRNIQGTGVTLAFRVQAEAKGGEICISQTVFDVVRDHLSLQVNSLGSISLKGFPEPMNLYTIL